MWPPGWKRPRSSLARQKMKTVRLWARILLPTEGRYFVPGRTFLAAVWALWTLHPFSRWAIYGALKPNLASGAHGHHKSIWETDTMEATLLSVFVQCHVQKETSNAQARALSCFTSFGHSTAPLDTEVCTFPVGITIHEYCSKLPFCLFLTF